MSDHIVAGVIGLGSMGMGVARSLRRAGVETWGFDVVDTRREELEALGGRWASNPADLGSKVDVVIVLVVSTVQVRGVLFGEAGAADRMASDTVVVNCATIPASDAVAIGQDLAARRIYMLDAPISGGAVGANAGELSVMASGPEAAFSLAEPVLQVIAKTVYRLGEAHGVGSTVKTINQLLAGVHIAAACEAMALGIRAGVDPKTLFEVISNSAGASWMFNNRVPHILDGDYAPKSAVDIFVKDLGIVLETGKRHTFPLPLSAAAHQQFLAAAAAGLGREDDSAVIKVFQKLAGFDLPEASE
jgi:3-hydroxyisobutyrate dehydrogenase